jgi:hypothetical protein
MVAGVGQHVRVASSSPPTLSVRHGENLRAVTVEVAAQLVIAESHDEVRAGVVGQGDGGSGLELEFGDAYAVFHKKNFPGAAVEDVEAAVVLRMGGVPVDRGLPKFVVLEKLDGDVAERLEGNISENVREGRSDEADLSVGEREADPIFSFPCIDDLSGADHDVNIVMPAPVHPTLGMRGNVEN